MAWVVDRQSAEQIPGFCDYIVKNLWLKPKSFLQQEEAEPVKAFITDETVIRLPFYFGSISGLKRIRVNTWPAGVVSNWTFVGTLRDYQVEMVTEVIGHLQRHGSSKLNAFCSAGKTVMGVWFGAWVNWMMGQMKQNLSVTIITFPFRTLIVQWINSVMEFSNARICVFVNGAAEYRQYENPRLIVTDDPAKIPYCDVLLCMVDGIKKLPQMFKENCQCLIIDECHMFCTQIRNDLLLQIQPTMVVILTATIKKPSGLEPLMDFMGGPHAVIRIDKKRFTVIKHKTKYEPEIVLNSQQKPDWGKIVTQLVQNDERNNLLVQWCVMNPHKKICILTNRVDHVEKLVRLLEQAGESVSSMYGSKSSYNDARILIASTSKVGTGFDQGAACLDFDGRRINMLILAISTKQIEQLVGRAFRSQHPVIIHIMDNLQIMANHWKEVLRFYNHVERKNNREIIEVVEPMTIPELN